MITIHKSSLAVTLLAILLALNSCSKDVSSAPTPPPVADDGMVIIPAGKFKMGCNPAVDPKCNDYADEQLHEVFIDEFQIDKLEVTFAQFEECVNAGICQPPASGGACNYGWEGINNFPVNCVSWEQAKIYCEKFKKKRLPTEAEWEKAARGTDSRIFPWGNESPTCNYAVMDRTNAGFLGCGTGNVHNVGSKPAGASPYGALDMAGNLWEWTADWYSPNYYPNSPTNNPKGPATGTLRAVRGGDFFSRTGQELRTSVRFQYEPSDYSIAVGFRCAK